MKDIEMTVANYTRDLVNKILNYKVTLKLFPSMQILLYQNP